SDQKNAGSGVAIEVTRAGVQLANDRQRILVASNERSRARLELLRAIGAPLDSDVELVDTLEYRPTEVPVLERAVRLALDSRDDWKAQQKREEAARISAGAARLERAPSVHALADYGAIGTGIDHSLPTRSFGVSVRIPIFDGGSRDARRAEASS